MDAVKGVKIVNFQHKTTTRASICGIMIRLEGPQSN